MGKEIKAAKQLSFIVLVFLITHSPFVAVTLLGYFYRNVMTIVRYQLYYKICMTPIMFNSFMNPIVYAMKSKLFRGAFKLLLCKRPAIGRQRLSIEDSQCNTVSSSIG
jgi:hypothetical protein